MRKVVLFLSLILILASCEKEVIPTPIPSDKQSAFTKADYLGTWRMHQQVDPTHWGDVIITDSSVVNYVNILLPFTNTFVHLKNNGNWSVVDLPKQQIIGGLTNPDPMMGCELIGTLFLNAAKDSLTIIMSRMDWDFYSGPPDTTYWNTPFNDGYHADRVICIR